jgi:shikimate kinase
MRNIAFIGMPGCGKTTVSRAVADTLGRDWVDIDEEIERAEGMSIPDIFASRGEDYFRAAETAALETHLNRDGCVVSVGGGGVLRNEALIRARATVVYLTRDISDIATSMESGTRPLVKSLGDLTATYNARRGIYERMADITVHNSGGVRDVAQKVTEAIKNEAAHN